MGIRSLFIFAALIAALTASVFSENAKAASNWDQMVGDYTVRELKLGSGENIETLSVTEYLSKWESVCESGSTSAYARFIETVNNYHNGGRWAVANIYNAGADDWDIQFLTNRNASVSSPAWYLGSEVSFTITDGSNANSRFAALISTGSPGTHKSKTTLSKTGASTYNCTTTNNQSGSFPFIGRNSGLRYYVLLSNFNVTYPPGYAGEPIPDEVAPPVWFEPKYTWQVNNAGLFNLQYVEQTLPGSGSVTLEKWTDDWAVLDTQLDNKSIPLFKQFNYSYELPAAGWYKVYIEYDSEAPEGFTDVREVVFEIYWNGASFIQGGNENTDDGIDGVYNNLSGGGILSIFNSLNIEMYGLQNLIVAPLNFIQTLPGRTCAAISIPILGTNQPMPCLKQYYDASVPELISLYQTILTGLVAWGVGFGVFRIIKDVNTPQNDRIEVTRL